VRKGDTVQTVAENFAVPEKMVRSWNRLKGNSLMGRKVLYLHLPVTPGRPEVEVASKSSKKSPKHTVKAVTASTNGVVVQHKVKQGETLYSIANSYNTTVAALQRFNRNTATLRPGMILVVRSAQ
jgi:LysM repeat protein